MINIYIPKEFQHINKYNVDIDFKTYSSKPDPIKTLIKDLRSTFKEKFGRKRAYSDFISQINVNNLPKDPELVVNYLKELSTFLKDRHYKKIRHELNFGQNQGIILSKYTSEDRIIKVINFDESIRNIVQNVLDNDLELRGIIFRHEKDGYLFDTAFAVLENLKRLDNPHYYSFSLAMMNPPMLDFIFSNERRFLNGRYHKIEGLLKDLYEFYKDTPHIYFGTGKQFYFEDVVRTRFVKNPKTGLHDEKLELAPYRVFITPDNVDEIRSKLNDIINHEYNGEVINFNVSTKYYDNDKIINFLKEIFQLIKEEKKKPDNQRRYINIIFQYQNEMFGRLGNASHDIYFDRSLFKDELRTFKMIQNILGDEISKEYITIVDQFDNFMGKFINKNTFLFYGYLDKWKSTGYMNIIQNHLPKIYNAGFNFTIKICRK